MEIRRHCSERLKYGERVWRMAAADAGFTGVLIVDGIGRSKWSKSEINSPRRETMGVTRGLYVNLGEGLITVFVYNSPCANKEELKADPFLAFLHELGHHRQRVRGVFLAGHPDGRSQTRAQWKKDHLEISAERYMRRQAKNYGLGLVAQLAG